MHHPLSSGTFNSSVGFLAWSPHQTRERKKTGGKLIIIINYSQVLLILIIHVIDHHLNHYHYGRCVAFTWISVWMRFGTLCARVHVLICLWLEWFDQGVWKIGYFINSVCVCVCCLLFCSFHLDRMTMKSKSVDWKLKRVGSEPENKNLWHCAEFCNSFSMVFVFFLID